MSAYLCHADTFDMLATFANRPRRADRVRVRISRDMPDVPALISDGTLDLYEDGVTDCVDGFAPETVAAVLRAENIRSLRARYPQDVDAVEDYRYRPAHADVAPGPAVIVLKSVACLRYQSCEAADYEQTLACALLNRIERAAIDALPGYDDAPWGWERSTRRVVA